LHKYRHIIQAAFGWCFAVKPDWRRKLKYLNLVFSGVVLCGAVAAPLVASANQFKLPEEIGRIEAPRDLNLIQVEPTMLDERYYTTGRCERRQNVGNILPAGADIPDSDPAPVKTTVQSVPRPATAPNIVPVKPVLK
jgi:hypothetical protein